MIMELYKMLLPNNGERYDLSTEELNDLLYQAYKNGYNYGYQNAKVMYDLNMTAWAEIKEKGE